MEKSATKLRLPAMVGLGKKKDKAESSNQMHSSLTSGIFFIIATGAVAVLLMTLIFTLGVGNPKSLYTVIPSYEPLMPLLILIGLASAWLSPVGRAFEFAKLGVITLMVANGIAAIVCLSLGIELIYFWAFAGLSLWVLLLLLGRVWSDE